MKALADGFCERSRLIFAVERTIFRGRVMGQARLQDIVQGFDRFFSTQKKVALFCGAGVSAKAGLPTWDAYLRKVADVLQEFDEPAADLMRREIDDGELLQAAQYFEMNSRIPLPKKWRALTDPLAEYDSHALTSLIQLPISAFVTTNFDRALRDAYAKGRGKDLREFSLDDGTLAGANFASETFLARVHGRVEQPGRLVLTKTSFDQLLSEQQYISFLHRLFSTYQVIFIGYSFGDPGIRTVLRAVRDLNLGFHDGEHIAFLPEGAESEFVAEFSKCGIQRILYDPENRHEQLWAAIEFLASRDRPVEEVDSEDPTKIVRSYLATCFARVRLRKEGGFQPFRKTVVEGIVSTIIQDAGDRGVSEDVIESELAKSLGVKKHVVVRQCADALGRLASDKVCELDDAKRRMWKWIAGESNQYEVAIDRLVKGCVDRYWLREAGDDNLEVRIFLSEFFRHLVLSRGWDLGAVYASRRFPDTIDVEKIMRRLPARSSLSDERIISKLSRATRNLLMQPDEEEAELLAQLGRISFALELTLQSPRDAALYDLVLPERIYFDANILMPAIVPGHSFHDLYKETIDSIREAASTTATGLKLVAYFGFLNEIVSHKRKAEELLGQLEGKGHSELELERDFSDGQDLNVFVSAYLKMKESVPEATFDQFEQKYAPYRTESELKEYLEKLGFAVLTDKQLSDPSDDYGKINTQYEIANADQLVRRKSIRVLSHDVRQVAALNRDIKEGRRSLFVTADKGLSEALKDTRFEHIANSMISNTSLVQLVDLLIAPIENNEGIAKMMWSATVSEESERVRDHFVDKAVAYHNSAAMRAMQKIVDDIAEEAVFEMERENVSLDGNRKSHDAAMRILAKHQALFHSKMREVMELEAEKNER